MPCICIDILRVVSFPTSTTTVTTTTNLLQPVIKFVQVQTSIPPWASGFNNTQVSAACTCLLSRVLPNATTTSAGSTIVSSTFTSIVTRTYTPVIRTTRTSYRTATQTSEYDYTSQVTDAEATARTTSDVLGTTSTLVTATSTTTITTAITFPVDRTSTIQTGAVFETIYTTIDNVDFTTVIPTFVSLSCADKAANTDLPKGSNNIRNHNDNNHRSTRNEHTFDLHRID